METTHGNRLVAVYPSRGEANLVRDKLIAARVSSTDIKVSDQIGDYAVTPHVTERAAPGFWAWLLGDDVPDYDRSHYERHIGENRVIVSVYTPTEELHQIASNIMLDAHPLEIDDDEIGVGTAAANLRANPTGDTLVGTPHRDKEEVIPVVKEELHAGKRVEENHRRLRVYTVSRPVEDTVMLRDETVTVERRPATGTGTVTPGERTIDVTTRHETPVAEKTGMVTEEVVVRRDVTEHPETVRGTVQETRVEEQGDPTKPVDTRNRRP